MTLPIETARVARGPSPKPWLIGESNPYQAAGADPDHTFDLYPRPRHASGGRLCYLILRMQEREYLRSFVRRDLLTGKWSIPKARAAAQSLAEESGEAPLILLGAKVCAAFGLPYEPFTSIKHYINGMGEERRVVRIPHPSGLNRAWHEEGAAERARALVLALTEITQ